MIAFALLTIFMCLLAYAAGFVVARTTGPDSVEACRVRIAHANDKTAAAERSAQMWRRRALEAEDRWTQLDHDVTESTEILLAQMDGQTVRSLCPHGKRSGCEWCDARPALVMA